MFIQKQYYIFFNDLKFKKLLHVFVDIPGAPSIPDVSDIEHDCCVLTWRAPEVDGGTPITGYYVERSMVRANRWIRVTRKPVEETTTKVTDLIEDNEYQFRVMAENKVGQGPPGLPSKPILAKDPWGEFLQTVGGGGGIKVEHDREDFWLLYKPRKGIFF